jgi:hypothetical protein
MKQVSATIFAKVPATRTGPMEQMVAGIFFVGAQECP